MRKVIVTGGSGFIGTNLVNELLSRGVDVLSLDVCPPREKTHIPVWRKVDILCSNELSAAISEFQPTEIVHLAARTDLNETRDLGGYAANIDGVRNLTNVLQSVEGVERCLFFSTKLVCPRDGHLEDMSGYSADTLYGQSKQTGECIVRQSSLRASWCIVRPTSIWGPWGVASHIPYGRFFQMIDRGLYYHLGTADPPKSFGYVRNAVHQTIALMQAPVSVIDRRVFYLADYDAYRIRQWADRISVRLRGRENRVIPEVLVRMLAFCGDLMRFLGYSEPPLTSFRLRNMRLDTTHFPTEPIAEITGPLPYSLDFAIDETVQWMRLNGFLKSRSAS